MSKVQLQGNASGTGVFTIASPNSNTDQTLTLPNGSGTVGLVSGDLGTPTTLVGTNITGTANALNAGIGVNQTWQNLFASRSQNVTYTNSTGKPIQVNVAGDGNVFGDVNLQLFINGLLVDISMASEGSSGGGVGNVSGIVPNGGTYLVNFNGGSPSIQIWTELR